MKLGVPTIMSSFSVTPRVVVEEPGSEWEIQTGLAVAFDASWSERHGASVKFISERWKLIQPNMWRAT